MIMRKPQTGDKSHDPVGCYITIAGKRHELSHHPEAFLVIKKEPKVAQEFPHLPDANVQSISTLADRINAKDAARREELMKEARDKKSVAHHVYQFDDTQEELMITDRILMTLRPDDPATAEAIRAQYNLESEGRSGRAYIFKVTDGAGSNPVKIANKIADEHRAVVEACIPELLIPMRSSSLCAGAPLPGLETLEQTYTLFNKQWHLTPEFIGADADKIKKSPGIHALEAWKEAGFGDPNIVIAIIDDGFDTAKPGLPETGHPAFMNKRIHPDQHNFTPPEDENPRSQDNDFHGTPVASVATALSDAMLGVAPCCTLLPLRIPLGAITLEGLLKPLRHASERADVVNCSFDMLPSDKDLIASHLTFAEEVGKLVKHGGRRPGKGLVIVVSAGNHDAPINLPGEKNTKGIKFVSANGQEKSLKEIEPEKAVHSGLPELAGIPGIDGVVAVGAMSSRKRKAGYSNWGEALTVTAPSDNGHDIKDLCQSRPEIVPQEVAKIFCVDYPGAGLVAAVNRGGEHGGHNGYDVISADGSFDLNYTLGFGRTSGAAPIVTGVVGLILSANDKLCARQVVDILKSTADKDLCFKLDAENDPNLQDFKGDFIDGHSPFFGAGKVNALKAVEKALVTAPEDQ
jgi:subtilisin family serine protease